MSFGTGSMVKGFRGRWAVERWLDGVIAWATRVSRAQAWGITALAVAAAGLADFATGPGVWFGPLYLLIICLPAWALGWRAAMMVGLACAGVGLAANGLSIYPLGHLAVAWNMAMRILSIGIIVALVGGFRRSYDREWQRARSDGLTGVLNRQAFYEQIAAARACEEWGVLAYVDLDDFKQVNDRHGHAAGDEILRGFVAGVRKNIRAKDIFARIGGDEFLLFLPVKDEAEGYRAACELHARMNGILNSMGPVGCSVGVLVLDSGATSVEDADVELADRLMYQAKQEGAGLRIATRTTRPSSDGNLAFVDDDDDWEPGEGPEPDEGQAESLQDAVQPVLSRGVEHEIAC